MSSEAITKNDLTNILNEIAVSPAGNLVGEDVNGDISITRNITAGGNIEASGDIESETAVRVIKDWDNTNSAAVSSRLNNAPYGDNTISLAIGSDGNNRGLWAAGYNNVPAHWTIFESASGEVYTAKGGSSVSLTDPENKSITVTTTAGTHKSHTLYKCGQVCHLTLTVNNSSAVAAGANLCTGSINKYYPVAQATGASFYGAHAIAMTINASGGFVIRNASSTSVTISGTNTVTISVTYLTDEA